MERLGRRRRLGRLVGRRRVLLPIPEDVRSHPVVGQAPLNARICRIGCAFMSGDGHPHPGRSAAPTAAACTEATAGERHVCQGWTVIFSPRTTRSPISYAVFCL